MYPVPVMRIPMSLPLRPLLYDLLQPSHGEVHAVRIVLELKLVLVVFRVVLGDGERERLRRLPVREMSDGGEDRLGVREPGIVHLLISGGMIDRRRPTGNRSIF